MNANGQSIYPGAFSRDLSMPVWKAAMSAAHPWFSGEPVEVPSTVVTEKICAVSGQRPTQYCVEYVENPQTKVVEAVSTARIEYFREQNSRVPFCQHHAGADPNQPEINLADLETSEVGAVPVRPVSAVLIGDDPYHTELPAFALKEDDKGPGFVARRTSVLDSFDLSRQEEKLQLQRPSRLVIFDE